MHRTKTFVTILAAAAMCGCAANPSHSARYGRTQNDPQSGLQNGFQTAGGYTQLSPSQQSESFTHETQNDQRNATNPQQFNRYTGATQFSTSEFADGRSSHFTETGYQPQQYHSSALNLFGDVIAESLPTELDTYGETPDTANYSQITSTHEGSDFDPTLTPDGRTIIFASTQHRRTADLYSRDVNSQVITQLTSSPFNDVMPAISPDGQRIAFSSDRNGNWDLFVMPTGGGNAVQVTHEPAQELHASWSPDGQRLAFSRLGEVSGRWELWVIDLQNTAVAHFLGFGLFPEWCPTPGTGRNGGDQMVFQRSRERGERAFSIWTIDYANGRAENPSQLAVSTFSALINPTWSPDGKQVVYASVPNPSEWASFVDAEPEAAAIHMVNADGSGLVTLTGGNSVDLMPFWGRDGNIYYVSNRNGSENIWSMSASEAIYAATGILPSDTGFAQHPPVQQNTQFTQVPDRDEP